ncbi:chromosome partitioning protein ParB [Alishewanella longhuensis]
MYWFKQRLAEHFAAQVHIDYNKKGKGSLVINYSSLSELDGILDKLKLGEI